jgi:hypothetical protein
VGEHQGETQGTSLLSGEAKREQGASSVRPSVVEALDTDLDAYLDRELFTRPTEFTALPGSVFASAPRKQAEPAPVPEGPARTPSVLELAEEEAEWLRQLPPPSVKADVAPIEPLPGEARFVSVPIPSLEQPPAYSWSAPVVAPPQVVAPDRSRRMAWVVTGALLGVAVVGALGVGMLWTGLRIGEAKASRVASVPVAAAPAPIAVVEAPVAPPQPVVAAPPVSPVIASTVEAAPVQESPAPAPAEQKPVVEAVVAAPEAPATEPLVKAEPPQAAPPARVDAAPKQGRAVRPVRVASASAEPAEVLPVSATVSKQPAADSKEEETEEAEPAKDGYAEFDEEYARELGFTDKPAQARPDPKASRNVYIPPAPGEDIRERLTSADIMRVVVSHKAAIAGCIQEHRARTQPGAKGQFVARWSVLPDGSTASPTVETAAFRGTPLAQCIEGLVQGWKFPRHRVAQQEPIRFPFTF